MQLNPSEISELLKSRIQGLGISADVRTQGTVVSVTDGICRIHGLSDVSQGEMLEFPGDTFGLALNLERDSVAERSARPEVEECDGGTALSAAVEDEHRLLQQPRGLRARPPRHLLTVGVEHTDVGEPGPRVREHRPIRFDSDVSPAGPLDHSRISEVVRCEAACECRRGEQREESHDAGSVVRRMRW